MASHLSKTPIAVAHGDGIGPEIMDATLAVLNAAGARIEPTTVEIGQREYERGHNAGIAPQTWEVLERSAAFLKSPIMTPQGGGFKSLNVTIRKTLGLYANVRPCVAYAPFVQTKHPRMNVVIVRENEEDVYAGIEHRQTEQVMQCLKLITRPGCERIVRYAFEYAQKHGRKRVTCFTKDNIMKLTDGLFHRVFDEISAEYPDIENDHMIVDIGAAKLADTPEIFDVLVMPNLYGDILSDVAAQIAGSIGLAGTANIGTRYRRKKHRQPVGADFVGGDDARPHRAGRCRFAHPQCVARNARRRTAHGRYLEHEHQQKPAQNKRVRPSGHRAIGTQARAFRGGGLSVGKRRSGIGKGSRAR